MNRKWLWLILLLNLACRSVPSENQTVSDFRLLTNQGESFQLSRAQGTVLIVAGYQGELEAVLSSLDQSKNKPDQIFLLDERALVPNRTTRFPVLIDPAFVVAESLSLVARGDSILLEGGTGKRLTAGPLAKVFPGLQIPIELDTSKLTGGYPKFDYTDVAPIIAERCLACHRQGGIAPFAFQDARDLIKRRTMVEEVIMTGRMPPWEVEPGHRALHPGPALTPLEKRALVSWLRSGDTLSKDANDPLVAASSKLPKEAVWTNGEPDIILSPPEEFELEAEGIFDYRYVTFEPNLESDIYLVGAQLLPGEPRAVHHLLGFAHTESEFELTDLYQSGTVIAMTPPFLPKQAARGQSAGILLKKNSKLTLQFHLTSIGRKTTFSPRLGLYLSEKKPDVVLNLRGFQNSEIDIPPGDSDYRIECGIKLQPGTTIHGFQPHMHYRGRSATLRMNDEILVRVPNYNFDWQYVYWFKEPITISEPTTLRFQGQFDNSAHNPQNPDPTIRVKFGDQARDEMLLGTLVLSNAQESVSSSHKSQAKSLKHSK